MAAGPVHPVFAAVTKQLLFFAGVEVVRRLVQAERCLCRMKAQTFAAAGSAGLAAEAVHPGLAALVAGWTKGVLGACVVLRGADVGTGDGRRRRRRQGRRCRRALTWAEAVYSAVMAGRAAGGLQPGLVAVSEGGLLRAAEQLVHRLVCAGQHPGRWSQRRAELDVVQRRQAGRVAAEAGLAAVTFHPVFGALVQRLEFLTGVPVVGRHIAAGGFGARKQKSCNQHQDDEGC